MVFNKLSYVINDKSYLYRNVSPVDPAVRYGSTLGQDEFNTRVKERRSDMRACLAVCLFRRGWSSEEISKLMDESYDFNIECKARNVSPFVEMQRLTGLTKI